MKFVKDGIMKTRKEKCSKEDETKLKIEKSDLGDKWEEWESI